MRARDRASRLSREALQGVVEFLGHDLLEGRAPGTRGGDLAELYVQSLFKVIGLAPGAEGGYLQPVPLAGIRAADVAVEGAGLSLRQPAEVAGVFVAGDDPGAGDGPFAVEGEAVFAGFGVTAPRFDWDDFKDVDVAGKILVVRVGDPGYHDPALFRGREITYYSRGVCKVEQAAERGAAAVLVVHADGPAGYGWDVARGLWSREALFLPDALHTPLRFRGGLREEAAARLLAAAGASLDELAARSLRRDAAPVPLGLRLRITGRATTRGVRAANVIGEIPGRSPRRVVLSAHLDHLGRRSEDDGGAVLNGAIDNGSAVAAMVLAGKVLADSGLEFPYTTTLLACAAEEWGLLGSTWYVDEADPSSIVANINFESSPVWGPSRSVMGIGARYTTLEGHLREIAREDGVRYAECSLTPQGFEFRSDQFPFLRRGIPAAWVSAGEEFESGTNHFREFLEKTYHTPLDVFDPAWPMDALRQTVRWAVMLVEEINAAPEPPRWTAPPDFPCERRPR